MLFKPRLVTIHTSLDLRFLHCNPDDAHLGASLKGLTGESFLLFVWGNAAEYAALSIFFLCPALVPG